MNRNTPRLLLASFAVFLALDRTAAQGTVDDYRKAEFFQTGGQRKLVTVANVDAHWIEKSAKFWFRDAGPKKTEFLIVDPAQNTMAPAFDHERLAAGLARAAKQEFQATKLPFESFDFVDGAKSIKFRVHDSEWTCTLGAYECTKGPETKKERDYEDLSPDGKWAAFLKDHNLFLRYVPTGAAAQMTWDGVQDWDYAADVPTLAMMVRQGTQEVQQSPAVSWSPDSSRLVLCRIDSRRAGRFTSLQYVPPDQLRPKAFTFAYPLPGEILSSAEAFILDVKSAKLTPVKTPPVEVSFNSGPHYVWSEDSRSFHYEFNERGYKAIELRAVDAETGEQKVLLREQSTQYVDPGLSFARYLKSSDEILWSSERDGWNHLYLYSAKTGKLVNQVTAGPWVVHRVEAVDEKNRKVYFLAGGRETGEDPYQTHLYSTGLDGKGLALLSPGDATHSASVSPDFEYFVDNFSRPDLPGASVLRRTKDGSEVRVLATGDATELLATGWKYPEPFRGNSADGRTQLYGLIWRPSSFDPTHKYPVIEQIYSGPQSYFTPKTFPAVIQRAALQAVSELGAIVVMVDGRGTTGRSRAFHEYSYRNLGGSFEDHVAMIKQMAAKYPFMDLTRVGIYGTSAGGYGAAHAMLVFPEFYKVGVTISGDHDARLDKTWWNEVYQGYPVEGDYVAQSNVTMADRLEGHLLIEHGDLDDNVHPAGTMRFVDALIKANKTFDMLFVPNMAHGEKNNYMARRRWDYFVQYLLGVTPPHNFEVKTPAE
ncbi:MAG TPA: DPP IV N-terminal domain-containing protein [Candidatus Saccharimonadales bacterium]|nr:DPP IV N-terminal domain-containing protein [Candidatus Saccharimonadales bacterium]